MTKAKSKTGGTSAGGEALRRRVTELWKLWDDDLCVRLEEPAKGETDGPFTNLDLLQIVSEKDFPDGRQLGKDSWEQYQRALKLENSLKKKFAMLPGSAGPQRLAKELSDYGAARELAGYRAAQLEMLVADHVANLKATAKGNVVKTAKGEKLVQQLADFIRDNSMMLMIPTQLARAENYRKKINQKITAFAMLGSKQFERYVIEAFGVLRSKALVPYVSNLTRADRALNVLLNEHREAMVKQIQAAGISVPSTDKQFREAIELALSEM